MSLSSAPSHTSVLSERPTAEHPPIPPETFGILVASLLFAALIFGFMAAVHWLAKTPAPAEPEPEPERDQEWAHYPQPGDKS